MILVSLRHLSGKSICMKIIFFLLCKSSTCILVVCVLLNVSVTPTSIIHVHPNWTDRIENCSFMWNGGCYTEGVTVLIHEQYWAEHMDMKIKVCKILLVYKVVTSDLMEFQFLLCVPCIAHLTSVWWTTSFNSSLGICQTWKNVNIIFNILIWILYVIHQEH